MDSTAAHLGGSINRREHRPGGAETPGLDERLSWSLVVGDMRVGIDWSVASTSGDHTAVGESLSRTKRVYTACVFIKLTQISFYYVFKLLPF